MNMYNHFTLIGEIVSREQVFDNYGNTVPSFKLKVRRPFKNAEGKYESDVFKIKNSIYALCGCDDLLRVGFRIAVRGRIENNDGLILIAEKIMFMERDEITWQTLQEKI